MNFPGGRQGADLHCAVVQPADTLQLRQVSDNQDRLLKARHDTRAAAVGHHQVGAARQGLGPGLLANLQGFSQGLRHIAFYFFHNAAPFLAARWIDSTIRS